MYGDKECSQHEISIQENNLQQFESRTLTDYYMLKYFQHYGFVLDVNEDDCKFKKYYDKQISNRDDSFFDNINEFFFHVISHAQLPRHLIQYLILDNQTRLGKDYYEEYVKKENEEIQKHIDQLQVEIDEQKQKKEETEDQNVKGYCDIYIKGFEAQQKTYKDHQTTEDDENILKQVYEKYEAKPTGSNLRNLKYMLIMAKKYYEMIKMMIGLKAINCYQPQNGNDIDSSIKLFNNNYDILLEKIVDNNMRGKYRFGKLKKERKLASDLVYANLPSPLKVFENANFMQYKQFRDIVCQPYQFQQHPIFVDQMKFTPIFQEAKLKHDYQVEGIAEDQPIKISSNYPTMVKFLEVPNSWEIFYTFIFLDSSESIKEYVTKKKEQLKSGDESQEQKDQNNQDDKDKEQLNTEDKTDEKKEDITKEQLQEYFKNMKNIITRAQPSRIHLQGKVMTQIFDNAYFNIDLPFFTADIESVYKEFQLYKDNQEKIDHYMQYSTNRNSVSIAQYLQLHTFLQNFIDVVAQHYDWKIDIQSCFIKGSSFLSDDSSDEDHQCPLFFKLFFLYMTSEVQEFDVDAFVEMLSFDYIKKPQDYAIQINLVLNHLFVFCSIIHDDKDLHYDEDNLENIIKQFIELSARYQIKTENEKKLNLGDEQNTLQPEIVEPVVSNNEQVSQNQVKGKKQESESSAEMDIPNEFVIIQLQIQNQQMKIYKRLPRALYLTEQIYNPNHKRFVKHAFFPAFVCTFLIWKGIIVGKEKRIPEGYYLSANSKLAPHLVNTDQLILTQLQFQK